MDLLIAEFGWSPNQGRVFHNIRRVYQVPRINEELLELMRNLNFTILAEGDFSIRRMEFQDFSSVCPDDNGFLSEVIGPLEQTFDDFLESFIEDDKKYPNVYQDAVEAIEQYKCRV